MKSNIEQHPLLNNFGLVSAWHSEKTIEVNLQNQEQLKRNLVNLDFGIIELKSHIRYVDETIESYYEERLFFVPMVNLYELMLLGVKFQQSSVIYREQTTIKVLDTKVGRVLSSFPFNSFNQLNDLKSVYIAYVQSRNNNISCVLM
ncbi:MAG: hypothetical protein IPH28_21170 [Cytophagaceae bacterium]|nr:hypothetical protein [Cytophagaceae bacterium]